MGACNSTQNNDNSGASELTVTPYNNIDWTGQNINEGKRKRALLIGLKYSGTDKKLSGTENDVSMIKDVLINQYGYRPQDIIMITDKNFPQNASILTFIKNFLAGARPGDEYFLFYSGHGVQVSDKNSPEKDGLDEAIVNKNLTPVTDVELNKIISTLPQGVRLVAIIDACSSGTIFNLPICYVNNGVEIESHQNIKADVITISGSLDDQQSYDTYDPSLGKFIGALTKNLVEQLKSGTSMTWSQLVSYLQSNILKQGYKQTPLLCVSYDRLLSEQVRF